ARVNLTEAFRPAKTRGFLPQLSRATLAAMSRTDLTRRAALCVLPLVLAACATQVPSSRNAAAGSTAAPTTSTPGTDPLPPPLPAMPLAEAKAAFVRDTAAQYGVDAAYIESVLATAQISEPIV